MMFIFSSVFFFGQKVDPSLHVYSIFRRKLSTDNTYKSQNIFFCQIYLITKFQKKKKTLRAGVN